MTREFLSASEGRLGWRKRICAVVSPKSGSLRSHLDIAQLAYPLELISLACRVPLETLFISFDRRCHRAVILEARHLRQVLELQPTHPPPWIQHQITSAVSMLILKLRPSQLFHRAAPDRGDREDPPALRAVARGFGAGTTGGATEAGGLKPEKAGRPEQKVRGGRGQHALAIPGQQG
jgi:hypothetical protein